MIEIRKIESVEDFEDFKSSNEGKILGVKFSANWCGPCRVLETTIKGLDAEKVDGVLFGEIDVDNEKMEEFISEVGVRNIPLTVFYKNGFEAKRMVGNVPAADIYKTIDDLKDVDNN